jgi:hypothetical protein
MTALMEALREGVVEEEVRDLLEEWLELEAVEEEEVMPGMMHHLLVDLVAVVHVGWKVLNFWVLREVEGRVRAVVEEVVRLESEREC